MAATQRTAAPIKEQPVDNQPENGAPPVNTPAETKLLSSLSHDMIE